MALTNPAAMPLTLPQQPARLDQMSLASRQALAILEVDGIRPSHAGVALMQSIDSGSMTHAQAIQAIVARARLYAGR